MSIKPHVHAARIKNFNLRAVDRLSFEMFSSFGCSINKLVCIDVSGNSFFRYFVTSATFGRQSVASTETRIYPEK